MECISEIYRLWAQMFVLKALPFVFFSAMLSRQSFIINPHDQ
jgi:hypothetical protein